MIDPSDFPTPRPHELLYSVLSSYMIRGGYTQADAFRNVFVKPLCRPNIELLNAYTNETKRLMSRTNSDWHSVVRQHTMFSYYAFFLPTERISQAWQAVDADDTMKIYHWLCMPKVSRASDERSTANRFARVCPLCAAEQREKYGEAYWDIRAQRMYVTCCPIHGTRYIETGLSLSASVSPILMTAETALENRCLPQTEGTDGERELSSYIDAVMASGEHPSDADTITHYLRAIISHNTHYGQQGIGRGCDLIHLYDDLRLFCEQRSIFFPWPNRSLLGRLMLDNDRQMRCRTYEICLLAFFLGISADELARLPVRETKEEETTRLVKEMYFETNSINGVANRLHMGRSTVRKILSGKNRPEE